MWGLPFLPQPRLGQVIPGVSSEGGPDHVFPHAGRADLVPIKKAGPWPRPLTVGHLAGPAQLCLLQGPSAVWECLFTVWTDCRLPSSGHPLRPQGVRLGAAVWASPVEGALPILLILSSGPAGRSVSHNREGRKGGSGKKSELYAQAGTFRFRAWPRTRGV